MWPVFVVALLALTPAPPSRVGSLADQDLATFPKSCDCEFYRGAVSRDDYYRAAAEGKDRVFETRKDRTLGFVKIDGQLVTLDLADTSGDRDCRVKSRRVERWTSPSASVVLDLRVTTPGAEACWYQGRMRVTSQKRTEVVVVTGSCGC
jgi:hypothetical protein